MTDGSRLPDVPFAVARPFAAEPCDEAALERLVSPFVDYSTAQPFRGPGFVAADGTVCLILVAHDLRPIQHIRKVEEFGLIAWRWNDSPLTFVSFTLATSRNTPRPHVRWMQPDQSDIVQRIRSTGRFLVTVATPKGKHCGWHEAVLRSGVGTPTAVPDLRAFERLWSFPTPGLPNSSIHERFLLYDKQEYDENEPQIPVWAEQAADFWKTMSYDGPWAEDLDAQDLAWRTWGLRAWQARHRAAGAVQLFVERRIRDQEPSPFAPDGRWLAVGQEPWNVLVNRRQEIGAWIAALAGPTPDRARAHQCMLRIVNDPAVLFDLVRDGFGLMPGCGR